MSEEIWKDIAGTGTASRHYYDARGEGDAAGEFSFS